MTDQAVTDRAAAVRKERADTLRHAAELLRIDGEAERDSCAIGDSLWVCPGCRKDENGKCESMRKSADRLETSARVESIAEELA